MTTKKTSVAVPNDVDALSPSPDSLTLESGLVVNIESLRTRGMFKLLKIVTRGAGPIIMQMDLDFEDEKAFVGQLLGVIIMAIPEAEDEAIDFIRYMVTPAEANLDSKSKTDIEKNRQLFEALENELADPSPVDTINIISKIIENEAENIQALGKQLAAILKVQMKSLAVKN